MNATTHVRAFRAVLATLAVLAGVVVTDAIAAAGDTLTTRLRPWAYLPSGRIEDPSTLAIILGYSALALVAGGWVAARVGAHRKASVIFGIVMLIATVVTTIIVWNAAPHWFHIITVVMVVPAALLGGLAARGLPRR